MSWAGQLASEDNPDSFALPRRTGRSRTPSAALRDPDNIAEQELLEHQAARESQHTMAVDEDKKRTSRKAKLEALASSKRLASGASTSIVIETDDEGDAAAGTSHKRTKSTASISTSAPSTDTGNESNVDESEKKRKRSKGKKKKRARTTRSEAAEDDGNIDVMDIEGVEKKSNSEKSKDITHFFGTKTTSATKPRKDDNTINWVRLCKLCKNEQASYPTSLRRHLEGEYNKWAKSNDFKSMLPKARAKKKVESAKEAQTSLDAHVKSVPTSTYIKYTDAAFKDAAVSWLVETNQPVAALQHPKFQDMIHLASRAKEGVVIPSLKETRQAIINMFKHQMKDLRDYLASDKVSGKVSLTCDAWQAETADGYFCVTGHWIEEKERGKGWEEKSAVFGFVRMNNAHNGARLGCALFKICDRIAVAHRVFKVTCDNATNNDTMCETFSSFLATEKGIFDWDATENRVRCIAHIINLATQALLKAHSKSTAYNPKIPDEERLKHRTQRIQNTEGKDVELMIRDEVGLVREICVKARSSAQRKQILLDLQSDDDTRQGQALMLLLDMVVRWSSTFVMLHRAYQLKKYIPLFIYQIGRKETNVEKKKKLDDLDLSEDEWTRVNTLMGILSYADAAQQAFSSDNGPSLHLVLPAMEGLHHRWLKIRERAEKDPQGKYGLFKEGLDAGIEKLEGYYERVSESEVYLMALLLDPAGKFAHIKKYWGEKYVIEVEIFAERIYKKYYEARFGKDGDASRREAEEAKKRRKGQSAKLSNLLFQPDGSEEESEQEEQEEMGSFTQGAHYSSFRAYLDEKHTLDGKSVLEWWGYNYQRYTVWGDIARDYLAIMASSVPSERAFSQAGITISKRRNRLGADIVEALQCLKFAIHRDLMFRTFPSSILEGVERSQGREGSGEDKEPSRSWDEMAGPDCEDPQVESDTDDVNITVL